MKIRKFKLGQFICSIWDDNHIDSTQLLNSIIYIKFVDWHLWTNLIEEDEICNKNQMSWFYHKNCLLNPKSKRRKQTWQVTPVASKDNGRKTTLGDFPPDRECPIYLKWAHLTYILPGAGQHMQRCFWSSQVFPRSSLLNKFTFVDKIIVLCLPIDLFLSVMNWFWLKKKNFISGPEIKIKS